MANEKKPAGDPVPRKKKKGDRPAILLDPELHKKLKHVCTENGLLLREYVDKVLRPSVQRDYDELFQGKKK